MTIKKYMYYLLYIYSKIQIINILKDSDINILSYLINL